MPSVFSLGRGLKGFTLSGSSDGLSVLSGATRPGLGAGRAGFTPFVSSDLGATFSGACRSALGTGFIGVTASGFGAGTARFSGTYSLQISVQAYLVFQFLSPPVWQMDGLVVQKDGLAL